MRSADIDEHVRRAFESDRLAGKVLPIEHYLPAAHDPACLATLEEMIQIELELAWKQGGGSGPLVETYLARFPILNAREIVLRLLEQEEQVRAQYAEAPHGSEYRARFPEWFAAEELPSTKRGGADSEAPSPRPMSPACPARIGKYVIVQALDHGGQAQVYRGVHPTLGHDIVIKLASRGAAASQTDRERLVAEGRILATLDHPNLARVYDLDVDEGRPFLVMEYVRGRNLEQYAKQQPVSPQQAAGLVACVARALSVAHGQGVIHKDIKPKNILVGEDGRPRLIDFGLAHVQHAWAECVDQAGWISGTVQYMAPEQARGENDRVDPRSDVFALGGVLFFLLTGEPPYPGKKVMEILDRARQGDWNRPLLDQARAPRRLRAICCRALAKEPAERYARAVDLAAELDAVARGGRRARIALAALAGVLTILALWLSRGLWGSGPEHSGQPLSLSVAAWRGQRYCPLIDAAPLCDGDEIRLKADIPPELHVSLFWFSSSGELTRLAASKAELDRFTLEYPSDREMSAPLTGAPGTEFVLICGRRSAPIGLDDLLAIWGEPTSWPELPQSSVLRLLPEEVRVEQAGRGLGDPQGRQDPEGEVCRRLEQLRSRLAAHFDYFEGLAFAHQE